MMIAKGLLPTGLDFGPDGALYFADWIDGWNVKNEGRIWKLDVPGEAESPIRKEVHQLMTADYSQFSEPELGEWLSHQDMRIRRKAQFELVNRGQKGMTTLQAATQSSNQLARIHGIWGIAQMARVKNNMEFADFLRPLLKDNDPEIQTQAAKMLGDVKYAAAGDEIIPLLKHNSLRVQMHAAEALGRMEHKPALQPLLDMLEANNDKDSWLRHAGMIALGRLGEEAPLRALKDHESRALKIGAVVALRRMQSPAVADFLKDDDEYIVTEAARAINDDYSIPEALPALANVLVETPFTNEALIRRAINAALRVGESTQMQILSDYAKSTAAPAAMRAEAIATLSTWANPSPLDRVDGRYRGEVTRDETPVKNALQAIVPELLNENNPDIQIAAIRAVGKLNIADGGATLFTLAKNNKSKDVRIEALHALNEIKSAQLDEALELALNDRNNEVRSAALEILPNSSIAEGKAVQLFENVLRRGSPIEKQAVLASLGSFNGPEAVKALGQALSQLVQGRAPAEIQLDIIEAVEAQKDSVLLQKLQAYQTSKPADDKLAPYREALAGGNVRRGRSLFFRHEAAQCVRCHTIFEFGGNAGPGLADVGHRLSREQLLESLVDPSAVLAKGYGVVSVELTDGEKITGVMEDETNTILKLSIGKEGIREIAKADIAKRTNVPSSMPPMGAILTKKEIRDMVAFLSELKGEE